MSKKPPGYSFSALELFERCPFAYRKVRLERIPRGESEPLKIGSDCHKHVGDYLSRLVNTGQTTDWEWAGALLTPSDHPDTVDIFQRFIENFVLPPGIEAPGVEKKLAFTRAWEPCEFFAQDAYFRAVVDFTFRQGGLVVVQDWKTNRAVMEIEKNLQTRIYGWAVRRTLFPDAQEILLRLHFLRYGAEREILLLPEDLDTVPQELEAKIAVIEAEKKFDPTPGSFCGWCGVMAHCPVMERALLPVDVMAPTTREQAEKAATILLSIRTIEGALTDRLKAWVKENGSVTVGDLIYGPTLSVSYDLNPEQVVNDLLALGLEPGQVWPMLSLTKTSLDRGLKRLKRKELLDEILGQYPAKTTEKVGFHKAT